MYPGTVKNTARKSKWFLLSFVGRSTVSWALFPIALEMSLCPAKLCLYSKLRRRALASIIRACVCSRLISQSSSWKENAHKSFPISLHSVHLSYTWLLKHFTGNGYSTRVSLTRVAQGRTSSSVLSFKASRGDEGRGRHCLNWEASFDIRRY